MNKSVIFILVLTFCMGYAFADPDRTYHESKVKKNVTKTLKQIDWKTSLEEVKEEAQKKKKMIFWMQIVGELDGGL